MFARLLISVILASSLYGFAYAEENDLLSNSPFIPPDWGKLGKSAPTSNVAQGPLSKDLEFRGYYEVDEQKYFSVYDKSSKQGGWYAINEGPERFKVVRFDPRNTTISVKAGATVEDISLMSADEQPIPVVGAYTAETAELAVTNLGQARIAPSTPAPSGPPPTMPPNFTPPTPPPNLIRKMSDYRRTRGEPLTVPQSAGGGGAQTGSASAAPSSAPNSAGPSNNAGPSSSNPSSVGSSGAPGSAPSYVPPAPSGTPPPPPGQG